MLLQWPDCRRPIIDFHFRQGPCRKLTILNSQAAQAKALDAADAAQKTSQELVELGVKEAACGEGEGEVWKYLSISG